LLTSGDGGSWYGNTPLSDPNGRVNLNEVVLWNVNTVQPLQKFSGAGAKTIATLSPDNKYAIYGDENTAKYIWNIQTGQNIFPDEVNHLVLMDAYGLRNCFSYDPNIKNPPLYARCKQPHDGYPAATEDIYKNSKSEVFNLKFIDNNHYLQFGPASSIIALYEVTNPKPIRYLSLGKYPWPITRRSGEYSRDQALDTAPAAHILVTAQADGEGIIVYQYDPQKLTLTKIWAPGADNWHLIKLTIIGFLLGFLLQAALLVHWKNIFTIMLIGALAITLLITFMTYRWGITAGLLGIILGIIITKILRAKKQ
jgi:WD40 repeat protein